jgi:hypothetical protein
LGFSAPVTFYNRLPQGGTLASGLSPARLGLKQRNRACKEEVFRSKEAVFCMKHFCSVTKQQCFASEQQCFVPKKQCFASKQECFAPDNSKNGLFAAFFPSDQPADPAAQASPPY